MYEGVPDEVVEVEVADNSSGAIGSDNTILPIFLGSHMAQAESTVVAHEVEEVVFSRDENLADRVLDTPQACGRVDKLIVGPVVSRDKVIQLPHDIIMGILRESRVAQLLIQLVELVQ